MIIQAQVPYYSEEMKSLLADSNFLLEEGIPIKGKNTVHFSLTVLLNQKKLEICLLRYAT